MEFYIHTFEFENQAQVDTFISYLRGKTATTIGPRQLVKLRKKPYLIYSECPHRISCSIDLKEEKPKGIKRRSLKDIMEVHINSAKKRQKFLQKELDKVSKEVSVAAYTINKR